MGTSVFRQAAAFLRERRTAARALAVLLCLAAVVAVATAGLLSVTGETLTHRVRLLTCPAQAHEHGPECLDEEGALVCGQADYLVHVHNADCYGPDGALSCTLAESPRHTHGPECWQEIRTPVCGLEETPGHRHGEDCYDRQRGELICGLEEHTHGEDCYTREERLICQETGEEHSHDAACFQIEETLTCPLEEHTHGDGCYAWAETLLCDIPEGEGAHIHEDACYELSRELVCQEPELTLHTHTDACRDGEGRLICGEIELLEHVHGEECFTIKELNDEEILALYGKIPEGLEEVPEAADGFVPAEPVCGLEEHVHDESCLDENGEPICGLEEHTHGESCLPAPAEEEPEPQPETFCGLEEHVHDESCLDETGEPICGLAEHTHGEGCLIPTYRQTAEAEGVRVTAVYTGEAGIPQDAQLRVARIQPEGEDAERYEERLSGLGEINHQLEDEALIPVALLNIGFFLEDGTEIAPEAPVTITIQFLDETGEWLDDSLRVVHFAETGPEVLEPPAPEEGAFTFSADGFSDFLITSSVGTAGSADYGIMTVSEEVDRNFEHKKQIDYLGDNDGKADKNNPDTVLDDNNQTVTDDLYRLYLDMEGKSEPANLLLIIDRSDSMNNKIGNARRDVTLFNLLTGTGDKKGLLQQFLERNAGKTEANDKSYAAAVWFGGDYKTTGGYAAIKHYINAKDQDVGANKDGLDPTIVGMYEGPYTKDAGTVFDWTDTYSTNLLKCTIGTTSRGKNQIGALPQVEGTNYCAGLMAASAMLTKPPNENPTIVIFLSDGLPTYFYQAGSFVKGGTTNNIKRYGEALEDKSLVCAYGLRARETINGTKYGKTVAPQYGFFTQTLGFFENFKAAHENIHFFTVGIGVGGNIALRQDTSYNGNGGYYLTKEERAKKSSYPRSYSVMESMGEGGMKKGNDAAALEKVLREIIFPSNVTITDELSDYVTFYKKEPEVLVTATNKSTGNVRQLWKGSNIDSKTGQVGEATDTNTIDKVQVVKSVTVQDKIVTLTFNPDYALSPNYIYTLSFNVRVVEKAFNTYAKGQNADPVNNEGYVTEDETVTEPRGDPGTDYGKNKTSSEKPGFFSNKNATVKYKIDGKDGELPYDMPVVQVWGSDLTLNKVDEKGNPIEGVCFCLQRALDEGKFGYPTPRRSGGKVTGADLGLTGDEAGYTFYKTNAGGQIQYKLLLHGKYTLYEHVPEDYEGAGELKKVAEFTVAKGRITFGETADNCATQGGGTENKPNVNTTYHVSLTVANTRRTQRLRIYKKDDSGQNVGGAMFQLHRAAQAENGYTYDITGGTTQEDVWTSNEEGLLFTGTLPFGLYALAETRAPVDYESLRGELVFKLGDKGLEFLAGPKEQAAIAGTAEDGTLTLTVTDKRITAAVRLIKVDGSDQGKRLGGAEFALYDASYKRADGSWDESAKPLWQGVSDPDTGILADELQLKAGETYYLVELQAPDGYERLPAPILITVGHDGKLDQPQLDGVLSGGGIVQLGETDGTTGLVTVTIANSNGYRLPEAGGPGLTGVYALGLLLFLCGAALLPLRHGKFCTYPSREKNNQKTEEKE